LSPDGLGLRLGQIEDSGREGFKRCRAFGRIACGPDRGFEPLDLTVHAETFVPLR
jgi:hypothetical protein